MDSQIKSILRRSGTISLEVEGTLRQISDVKEGRKAWKTYEHTVRSMLRKARKGVHLRARVKWRTQMKEFKHCRDQQRENTQELKKYLDYALKRTGPAPKSAVLLQETKEGIK